VCALLAPPAVAPTRTAAPSPAGDSASRRPAPPPPPTTCPPARPVRSAPRPAPTPPPPPRPRRPPRPPPAGAAKPAPARSAACSSTPSSRARCGAAAEPSGCHPSAARTCRPAALPVPPPRTPAAAPPPARWPAGGHPAASRVLPQPPAPVSVSRRVAPSNATTSVISSARPTKLVSGLGRFVRRAGSATPAPAAATTTSVSARRGTIHLHGHAGHGVGQRLVLRGSRGRAKGGRPRSTGREAPRQDVLIELCALLLGRGIEFPPQRLLEPLVLAQRLVASTGQRVQAHQRGVRPFVRGLGCHQPLEQRDRRRVLPPRRAAARPRSAESGRDRAAAHAGRRSNRRSGPRGAGRRRRARAPRHRPRGHPAPGGPRRPWPRTPPRGPTGGQRAEDQGLALQAQVEGRGAGGQRRLERAAQGVERTGAGCRPPRPGRRPARAGRAPGRAASGGRGQGQQLEEGGGLPARPGIFREDASAHLDAQAAEQRNAQAYNVVIMIRQSKQRADRQLAVFARQTACQSRRLRQHLR